MKRLYSKPIVDGYRMPAEYEHHEGTIMIWPVRPGSWPYGGKDAKESFTHIADIISRYEKLYMLADSSHIKEVKERFKDNDNVVALEIETNDSWARDVGPTFVIDKDQNVRGIDWQFNAWGGEYDGLYANWDKDNKAAASFCESLGYEIYDKQDFVLEGGSIHSDGEGTILVTESCLLSGGRNPDMTKQEIEATLLECLGARKVIWLPRGIYNDETNEHVDNICAFVGPARVVLGWTDDENDPQYELSKACLDVLMEESDAKGRKIEVEKLYIPDNPIIITSEDLEGYEFEEGEDERQIGERLAASYVNFYISNGAVLVPQFEDEMDSKAIEVLKRCFTDREVIGIPARTIILGGGNIHCITQQIPG